MKAADIMSTNLVIIDSLATIAEAARIMQHHNVRALIVDRVSEEDAYGIITETDISRAIANAKNPSTTYVCQVMTKPCIVVNPDLAVEHIAKLFTRAKIHVAPVIKDKLLGIVSLSDILSQTNYLIPMAAKSAPQTREELANLPVQDIIYENWCSG